MMIPTILILAGMLLMMPWSREPEPIRPYVGAALREAYAEVPADDFKTDIYLLAKRRGRKIFRAPGR